MARPYLLHLPPPFAAVRIDLDRPLEEQLGGEELRAATVQLDMIAKDMALGMRG